MDTFLWARTVHLGKLQASLSGGVVDQDAPDLLHQILQMELIQTSHEQNKLAATERYDQAHVEEISKRAL